MPITTSAIQTMQKRTSIRAFSSRPVDQELKDELLRRARAHQDGPFGGTVRFMMVDVEGFDLRELKGLGTYGMIRGARTYLVAIVGRGPRAMEDAGYCMELAILEATDLGLGTCWIGGSLNRSKFAELASVGNEEIVPAVTPLGYLGGNSSPIVSILGMKKGIRRRKAFGELFFEGDASNPINNATIGGYEKVLECVRGGPSASNRQPWRVIKEPGKSIYHLFLMENRAYNNSFGEVKIQHLDMGIAMCHFQLAANQLGLSGRWSTNTSRKEVEGLEYISTWTGA